jgi:hypothetical protein
MTEIIHGGCLCGFVRYEYTGDLGGSSYCHCNDCRRATGGPYTVGVLAMLEHLSITSGQTKSYTSIADSGRKIQREFCPDCGSPLFTKAEACPDLVFLKAGCLDKPEVINPSKHTWIQCAVPWAYIKEDLPAYKDNGPS